jgi:hypothetical protein
MKKRKPKEAQPEPSQGDAPSWVTEDPPRGPRKRTEEELELLVDGTIEGIKDTEAWKDLVRRLGPREARRILRDKLMAREALDTMVTWN